MSVTNITGTLTEVNAKIERIKMVIEQKKVIGYPLYHHAEKWRYVTHPDLGDVCPICLKHDQQIFHGDEVKANFPYAEFIGQSGGNKYVTRPRTHLPDLSKFADTPCNCEMILTNPAEAFEAQLHMDKEAVL